MLREPSHALALGQVLADEAVGVFCTGPSPLGDWEGYGGAYAEEVRQRCPHAAIVYDLFHVVPNTAVRSSTGCASDASTVASAALAAFQPPHIETVHPDRSQDFSAPSNLWYRTGTTRQDSVKMHLVVLGEDQQTAQWSRAWFGEWPAGSAALRKSTSTGTAESFDQRIMR